MNLVVPRAFLGLVVISMLMLSTSIVITIEKDEVLFLATTTSVDNSGLLQALIDHYLLERPHLKIFVAAKGTGAALQLARDGEADAVLVHAEQLEVDFVNHGFGINRSTLWYNYFVLVGPPGDPANVSNSSSIFEALKTIASANTIFVSRGDESGTHIREMELWRMVGLSPENQNWYLETGTGMARTLVTTAELKGYTLTDIGTYLQLKENANLQLDIMFNKEVSELYNPYSYIVVNPEAYPNRNTQRALDFLTFLKQADDLVRNYTVNGITLFHPIEEVN